MAVISVILHPSYSSKILKYALGNVESHFAQCVNSPRHQTNVEYVSRALQK